MMPMPPDSLASREVVVMWAELYAPYPYMWGDRIAYEQACIWVTAHYRCTQAAAIIENEGITTISAQGMIVQHPAVATEQRYAGQCMVALDKFMARCELLAPRDGKDHKRPWMGVEGAFVVPGLMARTVNGDEKPDKKKSNVTVIPKASLLLGGKGVA
jgi:hypothetical protein